MFLVVIVVAPYFLLVTVPLSMRPAGALVLLCLLQLSFSSVVAGPSDGEVTELPLDASVPKARAPSVPKTLFLCSSAPCQRNAARSEANPAEADLARPTPSCPARARGP